MVTPVSCGTGTGRVGALVSLALRIALGAAPALLTTSSVCALRAGSRLSSLTISPLADGPARPVRSSDGAQAGRNSDLDFRRTFRSQSLLLRGLVLRFTLL